MVKISISEAAKIKGVSVDTLRRWEEEGKLTPERTVGGHRRYDLQQLIGVTNEQTLTVAYARVNSKNQDDLKRQVMVLESFCSAHDWQFEVIHDLGSGLDYNNRGLICLIKLIATGKVQRLVVTHKDRLLRFGSELVFNLCEQSGTEVVIINRADDFTFEEDLASDLLELITLFVTRLYSSKNYNRKIIEEIKNMADKLLQLNIF